MSSYLFHFPLFQGHQTCELKGFALVSPCLAGLFPGLNSNIMSSQRLPQTKIAHSKSLIFFGFVANNHINYSFICLLPIFSHMENNVTYRYTRRLSVLVCLLYCREPSTNKKIPSGAKGNLPPKDIWTLNFSDKRFIYDMAAWCSVYLRILTLCVTLK